MSFPISRSATATTTASVIVTASVPARTVIIKNTHASATLRIGGPEVSTTVGFPIGAGDTLPISTSGPIYGAASTGTITVAILET